MTLLHGADPTAASDFDAMGDERREEPVHWTHQLVGGLQRWLSLYVYSDSIAIWLVSL